MLQLNLPSTWDITANNFSRRYFQMCFAGPSMGNSADADQMSPVNVLRQTACLVVNPITVGNFAFLFNCTPVGRTSDSMMVPT